jgi:hypothetical protein
VGYESLDDCCDHPKLLMVDCCVFNSKMLSAEVDARATDLSDSCPAPLAKVVACCIPLRMRTPRIVASMSKETPIADSPSGMLLSRANSFCAAFNSSSSTLSGGSNLFVFICGSPLAEVKAMES